MSWFYYWVSWVYYKDWPWIQAGSFVLHCISLLMKQHSFCSSNNELLGKKQYLSQILDQSESAEIESLKKDLGNYPNNLTSWNYWDFLLIPTFVYQLEYPRNDRFRLGYFLFKLAALASTFSLLYLLTEHYIHPVMDKMPFETAYESLLQLAMPFGCGYLLIFFIIFECVTNLFAEITLYVYYYNFKIC